jgi:hypothetical protein
VSYQRVAKLAATSAMFGLMTFCAPASAVTVTVQGTVVSTTGTNPIANEAFTLSFDYDPDIAGSQQTSGSDFVMASGGPSSAPYRVSPVRSVTFSVPAAGYVESVSAPASCDSSACDLYDSFVLFADDGILSSIDIALTFGDLNPYYRSYVARVELPTGQIPLSLYSALSIIGSGTIFGSITSPTGGPIDNLTFLSGTSFTVSGSQPSPVPLPSTFVLMFAALIFMTGYQGRRTHRRSRSRMYRAPHKLRRSY